MGLRKGLGLGLGLVTTLKGIMGQKTAQLQLGVTLSDNRQYTRTFSGSTPLLEGLFAFTSSEATKIELGQASGTAKLLGNHKGVVGMSANVCSAGGGASKAVQIAANLEPASGDGDLGSASGVAVPAQKTGATFAVDVRVNTGG